jgi:hypothetical protein
MRHRRRRALCGLIGLALSLCPLVPMTADAQAAHALVVSGRAGTEATLVIKKTTTITNIDWTNRQSTSQNTGIAIAPTSGPPIAMIWLPSLRHGPETVSTRLLPVKLASGRYTVTLLGSGLIAMRVGWSGANLRLSPRHTAHLKLGTHTSYQTAPFQSRWSVTIAPGATVMAGYIVYGSSDVTNVRYCFGAGQYACLVPGGGYSGVETSGGTMYYLTYTPGQLAPGLYEVGELAVSDSTSVQAGAFVVTLSD